MFASRLEIFSKFIKLEKKLGDFFLSLYLIFALKLDSSKISEDFVNFIFPSLILIGPDMLEKFLIKISDLSAKKVKFV